MTTWETGEFKEFVISRKLLEIELNKVHFWRLCFFELFEAEIQFFDQQFFLQISPQNFKIVFKFLSSFPCGNSVLNFQINGDLRGNFDDMGNR